jgi:hypothetical protein
MEKQMTAVLTLNNSNVAVTPVYFTQQLSTKEVADNMRTAQDRVVAAALLHTESSNSCEHKDTATDTGTSYDNSNDNNSVDNNVGIGPILDITAYNRFESTLAELQVHASDIVRVDKQAIGTGGFAKVFKVMLKGNQLCAAKVSAYIASTAGINSVVLIVCAEVIAVLDQ